jgi:hypothetical protein
MKLRLQLSQYAVEHCISYTYILHLMPYLVKKV